MYHGLRFSQRFSFMLGLNQTLMKTYLFLPGREINENNKCFLNHCLSQTLHQALGKCEMNKARFLSCKHHHFHICSLQKGNRGWWICNSIYHYFKILYILKARDGQFDLGYLLKIKFSCNSHYTNKCLVGGLDLVTLRMKNLGWYF